MLREFVEKKHYLFVESVSDWKEAIRLSCKTLEDDKTVEKNYAEEIIRCVNEYGPYIIIIPGVAMPHSQEGATGVNNTAIAFMKLEKPVAFTEGDPDTEAQLFFTLASCNHDVHLENMQKLSMMLMNEEVVEELKKATTKEELLEIQEKYLD
ncbi:MAG: PTS sugar transporter subunit IIA [Lachnospiraceae bacterium]